MYYNLITNKRKEAFAMETNYKKGKRLLGLSEFKKYKGEKIFLDDILIPVNGVVVDEKSFGLFKVFEAKEVK